MRMIESLKRFIRYGYVTNTITDTKKIPSAQVKYNDKVKDVLMIYPYGYSAVAPIKNLAVLVNVGDEEDTVAFSISGNDRLKTLKPGEVAIKNELSGSFVKMSVNGDILVNSQNQINIENASGAKINMNETAKFFIGNGTEELITWLEEFVTGVEEILISTQIGPQQPANKAVFTSLKSRIASLKQ